VLVKYWAGNSDDELNEYFGFSSAANNFVRKGQSMTSSDSDVVLSPTGPSVYFLTVENWCKAMAPFGLILAELLIELQS